MEKIHVMDDILANKIAAGEVVERISSVVKELTENSIDAGSKNIKIELIEAGTRSIKIVDDGCGMSKNDAILCFSRHATSKIRNENDLYFIGTLGFRGEALASIAAIAHVELVSKTEDDSIGHKIVVEGGKILEIEDSASQKGTTITVSNLFFNTPVRYKFLKKDFTEAGYIEDVVTRIALIHPEIAIKLINTGKTIIQTPGNNDFKAVIYSIYGKDIAENILEINYNYEDMTVTGVIGKPVIARSNRSNQLFFVNKRYVKDKTLTSAAEQGYKGLITIGKYGFLVLNVEMNPQKVDVNVHPAKLEVRFEEESKVFKAVYHAIRDGLLKGDLVADTERAHEETKTVPMDTIMVSTAPVEQIKYDNKIEEKSFGGLFRKFKKEKEEPEEEEDKSNLIAQIYSNKMGLNEVKEQVKVSEDTSAYELPVSGDATATESSTQIINNINKLEELKVEDTPQSFDEMYIKTFGTMPSDVRKQVQEEKEKEEKITVQPQEMTSLENVSIFKPQEKEEIPPYKFIGIAFSTYIILELNNELYILDQHAAHERILYEKVKKNYYSDSEKDSQLMLLPDIINLSHKEMDIAKENMDMFRKAGFTLEEFGENTIKLSGVPNICLDLDTKELFLETLDEINTVARTAKQEIEEKFIATVACKAAVKANMALTQVEVDNLLKQLLVLPNPFTCPHGRPTAIKMTKTDIERKFSRR